MLVKPLRKDAPLCVSDILALLERLGSERTKLKESVLIGCSEQNQVQFCLDVGENSAFTLPGWTGLH